MPAREQHPPPVTALGGSRTNAITARSAAAALCRLPARAGIVLGSIEQSASESGRAGLSMGESFSRRVMCYIILACSQPASGNELPETGDDKAASVSLCVLLWEV